MLKDRSSSAIVAVSDLDRARAFYAETLGLLRDEGAEEEVIAFTTGETSLIVYHSDDVRPGTGNAVVWGGGTEVESIADALRTKGVTLEEYPDLGMEVDNGIHKRDGFAGIWFKDPDGNILHVNNM